MPLALKYFQAYFPMYLLVAVEMEDKKTIAEVFHRYHLDVNVKGIYM